MKSSIHPEYKEITVTCTCGNIFLTRSTLGVAAPTMRVKVGDRVLISKYGGTEVKLEDKKYTLVREDDILGVIA